MKTELFTSWMVQERNAQNLTQEQLGEKMGASKQWVSTIENAATPPRWGIMQEVAQALGYKIEFSFTVEARDVQLF